MDAYDIFKQLTKGLKFKQNKQLKKNKKNDSMTEIKCKEEIVEYKTTENAETNSCKNDENNCEFLHKSGESGEYNNTKKLKKKMNTAEKETKIEEEELILLRKEHRISVIGKNIPPPIKSFDELRTIYNVYETLINNLTACNYPKPTPIQMQAIPILLQGRSLMACAQTGSGKTVAYLTPIINDLRSPKKVGFRAIILAPTRELAQQIYRECVRFSEKTALKIHMISKANQAEQKFGANSSQKFDILISTPNRIRFLLQQEPPVLNLDSIEWFIIDEADRLMEEGQNNFKEQLDDILRACTKPTKKIALFSATYTVPVSKWAIKNLKHLARVTIGEQNTTTELIEQELLFVGSESGKLLAIRDLIVNGLKPPVLVFVQSKDRAKQLFQELLYDGINVDVIHADRTQQQRDNCVSAFREGNIWVLICTELMGRGIDFKGVNLVINYDFPPSAISYIHRIGRTGRAGRNGKAITFFTQDDTPHLRSIATIIRNSGGTVPDFMLKMKKIRKSEKKKLANSALKRDDISTNLNKTIQQPSIKKCKNSMCDNDVKVASAKKLVKCINEKHSFIRFKNKQSRRNKSVKKGAKGIHKKRNFKMFNKANKTNENSKQQQ